MSVDWIGLRKVHEILYFVSLVPWEQLSLRIYRMEVVEAKYVQNDGIVLCVSFDVGQWMTNMCISVGVVEDIVYVQFVSIFGACFHSFQAIFVFVTVVTREHKLPVVAMTSRNQENDVHPHR